MEVGCKKCVGSIEERRKNAFVPCNLSCVSEKKKRKMAKKARSKTREED